MHPLIEKHLHEIRALCREYGVSRLELFGSAATDAFDPERSDVDFIVHYPDDYDYGPWLGRFQDLERALAAELGRDVDLVMTSSLRNRWFAREAAKTRTVIYDASKVSEVALTISFGRASSFTNTQIGCRLTTTSRTSSCAWPSSGTSPLSARRRAG